jgi:hypothetical protein
MQRGLNPTWQIQWNCFPVTNAFTLSEGWRGRGERNVWLPSSLWHSTQLERQSCQLQTPTAIYHQDISLVLETERTSALLNSYKRDRSLENFQGPCRKSNPEPPALRRSASANSTTATSLRWTALHDVKRHHGLIHRFPSHFPWSLCKLPY